MNTRALFLCIGTILNCVRAKPYASWNSWHGSDCHISCSPNCMSCYYGYGFKKPGCRPGWKGRHCNNTCDPGYYGYNCNNTCKLHCLLAFKTCDSVTGYCQKMETQNHTAKHFNKFSISGSLTPLVVINAGVLLAVTALIIIVVIAIRQRRIPATAQACELTQQGYQPAKSELDAYCKRMEPGFSSRVDCNPCNENKELTSEMEVDRLSIETGYRESSDGSFSSSTVQRYDIEKEDTTTRIKPHRMETAKNDILVSGLPGVILEQNKKEEERFKREFDGPKSEHDYIAAQGPRRNTINDFWQMVWQEHVAQIVMLTDIYEDGQIICSQYWPEYMSSRLYGSFHVKKVDEKHYAFYVVRKFTLSDKEQQRFRVVMQYQCALWNEDGATDPLCLAVFHRHVLRTRSEKTKPPIVVHCSNGMGRSGSYIALDALFKAGKTPGFINVEEYVKSMRSSRKDMVQTYDQYKVVYLALNEEFRASADVLSPADFAEKAGNRKEVYPTSETVIREEFKVIGKRVHIIYSIGNSNRKRNTDAKSDMLKKKNVHVSEEPIIQDSLEHISRNPVYVSSYTKSNAFIITRYPTPEDAADFLRMLIDNISDTIISMEPLSEIESSKAWFPAKVLSKMVGPYLVQQMQLKGKHVSIKNSQNVAFVEPNDSLVSNGAWKDTSYLRSLVVFALNATTRGPITVVCRDGASLCGIFCAVFNSVQQIRLDDSVDVFTTVRQLQRQNPKFVSTLDEYLLVHSTVRDYIETDQSTMHYRYQLEVYKEDKE